jgi:O-antigen/teichoic acid export membrane protein
LTGEPAVEFSAVTQDGPAPSAWGRLRGSRLVTQSAVFTIAGALVLVLGAVGKAILANQMPPAAFGEFAFCTSFLLFAALFFEFGLFTPAARRIARAGRGERSELIGASLLLFMPVGALFCIVMFGLSFTVEPVFGIDAGGALRVVSPLAFAYAFSAAAAQIAQGADRIGSYSVAGLGGQVVFVVALLITSLVMGRMTVTAALIINTGGLLITVAWFAAALRPRIRNARAHVRAIVHDTRTWGLHLYIGRVLSVGTYNMDVLMVAAFTDSRQVGFYVLATAIAYASGLPTQGLAAATFARMSRSSKLESRWLMTAWASGAVGVVVIVVLAAPLVDLVFSASYHSVAALAIPLAMAVAVRGATSMYNTFLSSQGLGKELRNCGLVLTISNVVLNFALIPPFGATGAAWASLAALLANYRAHVHYYRRLERGATAGEVTGHPPATAG